MGDASRYVRQMLVAEIGEAGQARLQAATFPLVGKGLLYEIACAYATRGGVGSLAPGALDEASLVPAFVENPAARSMVAGSRAALAAMRRVILTSLP
jgi:hypothetical protein